MVSSILGTIPAMIAILGIAFVLLGLMIFRRAPVVAETKLSVPTPKAVPSIPFEENDPDLREIQLIKQGVAQFMVHNEWTALADQIAEWEAELAATPGGTRYHDVAVKVALSGIQALVDRIPHESFDDLSDAEAELSHFLETHQARPEHHVLAILAARAHILLGETCHAGYWPEDMERVAWRKMAKHYMAAGEILSAYDPLALMSPLLGETMYLHALGAPGGTRRLPGIFEDWIELDPSNPSIYALHATQFADPEDIPDEVILRDAEFAMSRTEEILGFGGYALFFLPILELRPGADALLDAELLAEALQDLASNSATQSDVNWAANSLHAVSEQLPEEVALSLKDTLFMLIAQKLKVVYPRLWDISTEQIETLLEEASILADILPEEDENLDDLLPSAA